MRKLVTLLIGSVILAACSAGPPKGVDEYDLSKAIGEQIGDPSTCVVLAKAGGGVSWKYEAVSACSRARPACTAPGERTAIDLVKEFAAGGAPVMTSCQGVSWVAGPTPREGVVYAAVMQGERSLPAREIARRLEGIFERAGF